MQEVRLNKRVMITDPSLEHLHGRVGLVKSFDKPEGEYVVEIIGAESGELEDVQVKPEQLRTVQQVLCYMGFDPDIAGQC